jgi:hypothetical protein
MKRGYRMKTKRILALMLSLSLVVVLAACNNNPPSSGKTGKVELTTCKSTDFMSFTPCGQPRWGSLCLGYPS